MKPKGEDDHCAPRRWHRGREKMNKPIWKSKTFWSAISAVVAAAAGYATGELSIWQAIGLLAGGSGLYGLRDAISGREK